MSVNTSEAQENMAGFVDIPGLVQPSKRQSVSFFLSLRGDALSLSCS